LAVPFGAQSALNAPGPLWRRGLIGLLGLGLLSLAARRRWPLIAIAVVCGLALVIPAIGDNPRTGSDVGLLALFVAVYSLGAYGGRLQVLCGLPLPLAALAAHDLLWPSGGSLIATLPFLAAFVVGLPALAGLLVRERRGMVGRLEQQTADLMAERAARARHALGAERLRISQELHQVVTVTVHGLLTLVSDAETAAAAEGLRAVTEIEHVAREGLSEMRQLLGGLSQADASSPAEPVGLQSALHRANRAVELVAGTGRTSEINVERVGRTYGQVGPARGVGVRVSGGGTLLRVFQLTAIYWPAALAAAFYAFLEIELQGRALPIQYRLVYVVAGLVVSVPIAWCRSRPLSAAAMSLFATAAISLTFAPVASTIAATTLYLILPFCVAAFLDFRPALAGLAICAAALLADGWLHLASIASVADAATTTAPFVLGAWLAGRVLHARSRLVNQLRDTNRRLAEERDANAREVVREERQRVARDLHDVVGHSLTVIVLQAGAARRVWFTDRAMALASLANAARLARGALTELLQSLDALSAVEATASAGPGLELEGLVEMARLAGVHLEVRVEGRRAPLSPAVELALHRVVQEALTNALKHAPGCDVTMMVRYGPHGMDVDISNQDLEPAGRPPSTGPDGHGRGLPGMRERIESCGGRLQWERRHGRFRVHAQVPVLDG
jgi:signal transduction histidine kinase